MIGQVFYSQETPVHVLRPSNNLTRASQPIQEAPAPCVSIQEAIEALRVSKLASNRRLVYVKELTRALKCFARGRESEPLTAFTTADIESFLAARQFCPSARRGTIGRISTLFSFGMRRKWVASNPTLDIEKPITERADPKVLSPEECRTLMDETRRTHNNRLAYLALALFGGLRPTEAARTEWGNIKDGIVTIDPGNTKVRRRRLVQLEPAAVAWIEYARKIGAKLPLSDQTRHLWNKDFRSILGYTGWPQDIARHSALTYWMVLRGSAEYVALQAGNSAWVVHAHYKSLASQETAARFWAIMP